MRVSSADRSGNVDPETEKAAGVIAGLGPEDKGAALLDGLSFAIAPLAKQARRYRRAFLLFSETIDSGRQASLGYEVVCGNQPLKIASRPQSP